MVQLLEQRANTQEKIKPTRLKKGDRIGIVSPGRWMSEEDLANASSRLTSLGYIPEVHEQNYLRLHQFAGSDKERAEALQSVLCDPTLKAVMFAKSGYGTLRILDQLDYLEIAKSPKIVIGYSDATALLIVLLFKSNLVTYHGPMLYDLVSGIDDDTWRWFESVLIKAEQLNLSLTPSSNVRVLRSGIGEGELIGGNLTLLVNLVGTDADFETSGRILFIEDDDEHLYSIDRMMVHLKRTGKLANLAGLIVGQMSDIADDKVPFGYSVDEIILQHCEGTDFPIVSNFPFGHGPKQLVMPIGIRCRLQASKTTVDFNFLEAAVR